MKRVYKRVSEKKYTNILALLSNFLAILYGDLVITNYWHVSLNGIKMMYVKKVVTIGNPRVEERCYVLKELL